MTGEQFLDDLFARLELGQGRGSFIILSMPDTILPEDAAKLLRDHLAARGMRVALLATDSSMPGPWDWVELAASKHDAVAHVVAVAPAGEMTMRSLAEQYNAKRELLRDLKAPLMIVVNARTDSVLRRDAPDFCTWAASTYEIPFDELKAIALPATIAKVQEPGPPAVPRIVRFLHLSDLHLRPKTEKVFDQERVLRGLFTVLENTKAESPIDLIFLTGDLAFSGKPAEYTLVVDLLKRLLDVTGVPPEHVFVVPGNHDADREVGRWLKRTLSSDEDSTAFFLDPANRELHARKFAAFREALASVVGTERALGLETGREAVEYVELRGERIAVVSLNSAWFAQDDDDKEKLWVGEANLDRAAQRVRESAPDLRVALLHHPTDFLAETERSHVEDYLEREFDVVLRGHLHRDKIRGISTPRGGYLEIAAPAGYQGSQWPNGCFTGEIDLADRSVKLTPWCMSRGAGDPWVLDASVFPDDAQEGYRRTIPLRARSVTPKTDWMELLEPEIRMAFLESRVFMGDPAGEQPLEVWEKAERAGRVGEIWDGLSARRPGVLRSLIHSNPSLAGKLAPALIVGPEAETSQLLLDRFRAFWTDRRSQWLVGLRSSDLSMEFGFVTFVLATSRFLYAGTQFSPAIYSFQDPESNELLCARFSVWKTGKPRDPEWTLGPHTVPARSPTSVFAIFDRRPSGTLGPARLEQVRSNDDVQRFILWG